NDVVNSRIIDFNKLEKQSKHMIVVDEFSIVHQQEFSNIYSINKDGTVTVGYQRREK
ncbi:MAG: hypothetical protein GX753_00955, partial [Erysipelothrix sp.]|nr:hypothetical protein [Erysipelothrix sp.]